MAIHTLEELFSHSAAVSQQEQSVGNNKEFDSASALPSPTAISTQWRCEERMDYRHMLV